MLRCLMIGLSTLVYGSLISQNLEEISLTAFGVYQNIQISVDKETKFKVEAAVKADIMNELSWAGVYASASEKGESYGFYDNMSDRPIKSNNWKTYSIEGIIDEKTDTLSFGVQAFYTGKFYFDDIKVYIENDKGDYEQIGIFNAGFENKMKNNILPNWDQYHIDETKQKPKDIVVKTVSGGYKGDFSLMFDNSAVEPPTMIGKYKGATPQVATLITMLEDLRKRVFLTVENLDKKQTDYLLDDEANRIGALIMHLVAAEKYYQVYTFEGRSFNDEEKKLWGTALDLGDKARATIKGKPMSYYLDLYKETREETIRKLKTKDDSWLQEGDGRWTNFFCWFHVMEHQSSHLGQILFLEKRLPEKEEFKN